MELMFGGIMMLLWLLVGTALLAGAVAAVVWAVRSAGGGGPRARRALEELDLRYARGEEQREEYLQRRADLERK